MREIFKSFVWISICILFSSCKETEPTAIVETSEFELIRIAEDSCLATDTISFLMKNFEKSDSTLKFFIDGFPSNFYAMSPNRLKVEVPKKAVQGHVVAMMQGKEIFNRNIKVCPIEILSSDKDSVFFQDNLTISIRNRKDMADDSMAIYAGGVKVENYQVMPGDKILFKVPQGITDCNIYIESYGRVSNTYIQRLAGARRIEITDIESAVKYPDDILRFAVNNVNMDYDPILEIIIGGISTQPDSQYRDLASGKDFVIVRIPSNTQTNTLQVKYLGMPSDVKQFNLGTTLPAELDLSKYTYVNMTDPHGGQLKVQIQRESTTNNYVIKCDSIYDVGWSYGRIYLELRFTSRGKLLYFTYENDTYSRGYNREEELNEYRSKPLSIWPTNTGTNPHYYFKYPLLINTKSNESWTDRMSGEIHSTVTYSCSDVIDISFE